MNRRVFIRLLLASVSALALSGRAAISFAAATIAKITRTDVEWKTLLSPEQYAVLRGEGTEPAFASPLTDEHRPGVFVCAGCDLEMFLSKYKFDSGTGWPSFFDVIPGRVEMKPDYRLPAARTEYHCTRCGGHHGHVFNDGPKPTGLRYCNNGAALKFIPDKV